MVTMKLLKIMRWKTMLNSPEIFVLMFFAALLALSFLPTLIAWQGGKKVLAVFLINLLLGWSILGWLVALILAICSEKKEVIEMKRKVLMHQYKQTIKGEK